MLTKNGKTMIIGSLAAQQITTRQKNGAYSFMNSTTSPFVSCSVSASSSVSTFVIGSGTTPETEWDYCLENELTDITVDSFTVTKNFTAADEQLNEKLSYRATVTNNTSENRTISEIGIMYLSGNILWYRKTFEPIILKPNDTYTFAIDLM